MTEAEWNECRESQRVLEFLRDSPTEITFYHEPRTGKIAHMRAGT